MLKQLKIRTEIKKKSEQLEKLRAKKSDVERKRDELAAALEEATTDEDIALVEEEIADLEKEVGEDNLEEQETTLVSEIEDLEKELEETEERAAKVTEKKPEKKNRGGTTEMKTRDKIFGMDVQERAAFLQRDDIQEFLTRAREVATSKTRSASGAELLIPEVLLPTLKEIINTTSKLAGKVNLVHVKGTARQPIMATIPEAVWTEMEGALNELEFRFNEAEVDGYKVAGFVAIPNSALDDDETLLTNIVEGIGKSLALALDKSAVYGTGIKQPLGIVTRLAQTEKPSNYPANARKWENLSVTNVVKINETTAEGLWAKLTIASGNAKSKYSVGKEASKIVLMSEKTKMTLLAKLISMNVAGALAAQLNNQMPIIGGEIIELDFMPDGDVLIGYGDLYLLAEREGQSIATSEHAMFIQDNTVVKGVARYDGLPAIAEGFVYINIQNVNPTTSMSFAEDFANTEIGSLGITLAAGTAEGKIKVTVSGAKSGATLAYKTSAQTVNVKNGAKVKGYTTFESGAELDAGGKIITVVELDDEGRAVKVGGTVFEVAAK